MTLRVILFLLASLPFVYDLISLSIIDRKRREPLPEEVRDVYTKERWQQFVSYKHDLRMPHILLQCIELLTDAIVIFSPFYSFIERLSHGNPYGAVIWTSVILTVIPCLVNMPIYHYITFGIREKYGLNRFTKAEFRKDRLIEEGGSFLLNTALYLLFAFALVHIYSWTNGFSLPFGHAALFTVGILVVFYSAVLGLSWLSWRMMRMQYTFTPLEEGDLKEKILTLIKGSKKKVRKIEVYNESKKSTTKNAFVLKILNYRSIGIADNFLNENSEEELLAVLSHEAGHLKHKPDLRNWINWGLLGAGVIVLILLFSNHGSILVQMEEQLERSFHLTAMNPVLTVTAVLWLLKPLGFCFSVWRNYVSRCEEYEADRNAVKEGYGEALIRTFKEISTDELVDVNPSTIIEFIEYDHPGMAHRIQAIHAAEAATASS